MTPPRGWPFLVASGRRRDYRTLLAPNFLIDGFDYGVLDEVVRPTSVEATTTNARTRTGRHLTIVYATHLLTAADLAPEASGAAQPRDEHNRPLRLIYGFVVPGDWATEQTDADLRTARGAALEVYRRFLDDEDTVTVTPAPPFPLRSRVTGREPVAAGPTAAVLTAAVAVPARPPICTAGPSDRPSARAARVRGRSQRALWLAGAALAVAAAAVALIGLPSREHAPPGVPCRTVSATVSPPSARPSPGISATARRPKRAPTNEVTCRSSNMGGLNPDFRTATSPGRPKPAG